MFDIFYSGKKPNLFSHEQEANSIDHARELCRTRYFWWINYLTDYKNFDFLWEPVPWEAEQTHVWPSQWQNNGDTLLVPKSGGQDVNYNHAKLWRKSGVPVVGIDHGTGIDFDCKYRTRYIGDYLGTLRRVLSKVEEEYVWVASSVCDYTHFNWTWHPSEWQRDMLHVFPSGQQKFGDTFYVHVPTFLEKSKNIKLLEWFDTINFIENIQVPRQPMPIVEHAYDTHVQAIREYEFKDPLIMFSTGGQTGFEPTVCLWRELTKTAVPLTPGASIAIIPREVKNHMSRQVYDYPYIDKTFAHNGQDPLLDIVFIDNGEPNADYVYQHLRWAAQRGNYIEVRRISGVIGRAAAYRAAAELSTTPWFFAVFAKLWIAENFDWTWQPDRLQEPKHYIFHALNPVNGLVYGHQAMIAYNRQLVLENAAPGLDFTLDQAHEVVPIMSGTAMYDKTPWMAWRTAFRECIKLKCNTDIESEYRLSKWLKNRGKSKNGDWSVYGAEDAVEYYTEVDGDFDALKKSYDWAWLASYAMIKRNLLPDQ
jgi:hypothetical protein